MLDYWFALDPQLLVETDRWPLGNLFCGMVNVNNNLYQLIKALHFIFINQGSGLDSGKYLGGMTGM